MGMYYSLILVPSDPHPRPETSRIVAFLQGVLELGAVGTPSGICVRDHGKGRVKVVGRNPITHQAMEVRVPETTMIDSMAEVPARIEGVTDFDVAVAGTGPARLLAIRELGGFEDEAWMPLEQLVASGTASADYALGVACCQRSELTSTSDLHDETETDRVAVPFGDPCVAPGDRAGLYTNPETLDLIQVPDAGYSSFWIEFTTGKWLFPRFGDDRLAFVEPRVLQLAEAVFEMTFAEGCCWG